MGHRSLRHNAIHEANLTIRVSGTHIPTVETANGQVQVGIPGAVITLADAQAARGMFVAWVEAKVTARQVRLHDRPRLFYREPAQRIISAVLISGNQPGPVILGRAPAASPSGAGQVVVRLGRLTIVCDDAASFECQHKAWIESYEVAGTVFDVPDARTVAAVAEQRALDRLITETPG